ncbi:MAG: ABC transporter ATP-binding protein [Nanoarchaeota archaeon]|nr:ABC transporter ATP-binding protein [Nanoarchaeota archaeon]MBU1320800.1 ABC transporter ATP-binding protein [Nanoarchaeota archaeon]MBU1596809.1 ABC transporter ATP-binding protein [Nanoarchaeota archaeon]MBU2440879.1 ABC transporter ATP-binding protein [Nanoarchaeota archaeon]
MDNILIQIKDLEKTYQVGETQVHALRGVSFDILSGEILAIMGPSGSGKSTLMNIIGCLDTPSKGQYFLEGQEVSGYNKDQLAKIRNGKIGFVFQNFNLLARTTALENVELPLVYSTVPDKKAREMAYEALAKVGLKGRELHKTNQISGGEMQRVATARALVNNPSLILADEPTGNLDTKTGNEIMDLFIDLNQNKGITIILVTHDPEVVEIAHRIIYVRDGLIEKEQRR